MSKTILITGGAGFIGHHVVDYIMENTDWDIVSLDRLDFSGNLNRLHEIITDRYVTLEKKRIRIIHHDLKAELNPQLIRAIGKVDYIAHIAAGSHVDRSIDNPLEFVYDNVVGTANILNYARSLDSLERFVYFSTDEVFGPAPEGIYFREYDRYNSTNPYSATKAGAEELVVAFQNTYKLPAVITHTMNVFGERQHPEKYIPKCIRAVRDNEVLTVHADKYKTKIGSRHYIHARDVADALLFILKQDEFPLPSDYTCWTSNAQKFNIVGSEEIDNLQLATLIAESMNRELKYELVDFHSSRPGHDLRYALSGERMRDLGWSPTADTQTHISRVVDWTLKNDRWLNI